VSFSLPIIVNQPYYKAHLVGTGEFSHLLFLCQFRSFVIDLFTLCLHDPLVIKMSEWISRPLIQIIHLLVTMDWANTFHMMIFVTSYELSFVPW